jgi:hypothetical protein
MSTAKFSTWLNPNGTENYKCRAWVNFNGTGTVAIRAAGNVASITDNGTGDYTVNFTTAMPDANYSFGGNAQTLAGVTTLFLLQANSNTPSATALRILASTSAGSPTDSPYVWLQVFR